MDRAYQFALRSSNTITTPSLYPETSSKHPIFEPSLTRTRTTSGVILENNHETDFIPESAIPHSDSEFIAMNVIDDNVETGQLQPPPPTTASSAVSNR